MKGLERFGQRTSGDFVHHWSLDLEEISIVEEFSDVFDDLCSRYEDVACGIVHDEIKVALSIALFLVMKAVMHCGKLM